MSGDAPRGRPTQTDRAVRKFVTRISRQLRPSPKSCAPHRVGPEMAKVFREVDRFRMNSMQTSAKCIAARGPLRVSTRQAGEFIWILASRTLPAVLCDEFGWTESQHARWLADPQPFESRGRR
jgi:hypothetical protein